MLSSKTSNKKLRPKSKKERNKDKLPCLCFITKENFTFAYSHFPPLFLSSYAPSLYFLFYTPLSASKQGQVTCLFKQAFGRNLLILRLTKNKNTKGHFNWNHFVVCTCVFLLFSWIFQLWRVAYKYLLGIHDAGLLYSVVERLSEHHTIAFVSEV